MGPWLADIRDDHTRIAHRLANMNYEEPMVLIVGGSSFREAFDSDWILNRCSKNSIK